MPVDISRDNQIASDGDPDAAKLRGEIEQLIAGFVEEGLKLRGIDPTMDLFELGVDSIVAMQVFNRIQDRFCLTIDLEAAFSRLTIRGLSALVEAELLRLVDEMSEGELEHFLERVD